MLREEFNALPLNFEDNVFEYYSFSRKWGTHVIFQSYMGAQLFALHLHSSNDETRNFSKIFETTEDLLREVESLRAGESNRLTVVTVGGRGHNVDVRTNL